jgi:hypothetical protein
LNSKKIFFTLVCYCAIAQNLNAGLDGGWLTSIKNYFFNSSIVKSFQKSGIQLGVGVLAIAGTVWWYKTKRSQKNSPVVPLKPSNEVVENKVLPSPEDETVINQEIIDQELKNVGVVRLKEMKSAPPQEDSGLPRGDLSFLNGQFGLIQDSTLRTIQDYFVVEVHYNVKNGISVYSLNLPDNNLENQTIIPLANAGVDWIKSVAEAKKPILVYTLRRFKIGYIQKITVPFNLDNSLTIHYYFYGRGKTQSDVVVLPTNRIWLIQD